jgi:flagellar biosynthesis component FlhA
LIVLFQAYFHHPDDFSRFEDATQLYQRFTLFSLTFNLITTKLILIPSEKFPLLQLCLLAVDPLCALGD